MLYHGTIKGPIARTPFVTRVVIGVTSNQINAISLNKGMMCTLAPTMEFNLLYFVFRQNHPISAEARDKRVLRESAGPWMGLGAVVLAESPGRSLFRSWGGFSSENDLCYADR